MKIKTVAQVQRLTIVDSHKEERYRYTYLGRYIYEQSKQKTYVDLVELKDCCTSTETDICR